MVQGGYVSQSSGKNLTVTKKPNVLAKMPPKSGAKPPASGTEQSNGNSATAAAAAAAAVDQANANNQPASTGVSVSVTHINQYPPSDLKHTWLIPTFILFQNRKRLSRKFTMKFES